MIKTIQLSKLRNDEFIQFINDILLICHESDPEKLQIKAQYDRLKKISVALESGYLQDRKSELTDKIRNEDAKRDGLISGIEHITVGYRCHFNPDYLDAADLLMNRIKMYGSSISRMNYQAETAALSDLIDMVKSDKKLGSAVQTLALEEWFTALEESNTEFNRLYLSRVKEQAGSPSFNLKETRINSISVYRELKKHINAYAVINHSKLYDSVINRFNTLIDKYSILRRKSKSVDEDEMPD